jgi:hypothetical protein
MATPTARRYVEELETHRSPEEEEKVRRYFKYGGEDTNTPRRSEGRSEGEEEHEDGMRDRRDQRGRLHAPGTDHRPSIERALKIAGQGKPGRLRPLLWNESDQELGEAT